MMHNRPDLWAQLMDKLVEQLVSYLQLQISAGVEAVQATVPWEPCGTSLHNRRHNKGKHCLLALTGHVEPAAT